jgi:hypothetical protein
MKSVGEMARRGATYRCPACGQTVTVLVRTYVPECVKHYKRHRMVEQ